MGINIEAMQADLLRWATEEREAKRASAIEVTRCCDLDDAGILPGAWSAEGGIALARVLIRPGDGDYTPARALASLEKVCFVPDRDRALQALQFERGAMQRAATMTGAVGEQRAAIESMREGKRQARRRYRTRNNLTHRAG